MRHLRGYGKQYFSLAIIAMYSTLYKLCTIDASHQYHLKALKYQECKTSPPFLTFNY